ncbi:hypothetical protein [Streptomyces erythrochromogenes]|uniref:hypothetical protein n=1 Tax=Streptomyces erythrochromogenes TaxID=285574 RepID=UPI00368C6ABF
MHSIEIQSSTQAGFDFAPRSDIRHLYQILTLRLEKVEDDINGTLDAAMELIQSVRFARGDLPTGTGDCFAQLFLALQKKLTARDTLTQDVDSLKAMMG